MKEPLDVGRLVAFTDGVFAIAITLLVLNFDEPTGSNSEVLEQLTDQWPALLAYFLSFAVVGRFWLIHHRVFALVRRIDAGLLALNLFYLSFIVLIPFTTEVLGDYGDTSEAVILYGAVLGGVATSNWLMIRHALSADHIHPEHRERAVPFASTTALITPAVFLVSMPIGLVSPLVAELMWATLGVTWPLRAHRVRAAQETADRDTSL